MPNNVRAWRDIDLDFTPHPVTKDIVIKTNEEAIKRAVKNLLTIDHYEKPFHPEIGSGLTNLLFEPLTNVTGRIIDKSIREVLTNFEPRVSIISLNVTADDFNNGYNVTLQFETLNILSPITINLFLQRLR